MTLIFAALGAYVCHTAVIEDYSKKGDVFGAYAFFIIFFSLFGAGLGWVLNFLGGLL